MEEKWHLTFLLLILFIFLFLLLLVGAEGPVRQAVHPDHLLLTQNHRPVSSTRASAFKKCGCFCGTATPHLVGVLEDEVLALVQLAADVDDAAEDPPGVLHAQVDLAGELVGFELLRAQDDVTSGVLHVVARHVPEEDDSQSTPQLCQYLYFLFRLCVSVN